MPSSLIIVALAAAWLVVLVPMIARKRQEIARTADSALAARVVRSGGSHGAEGEEFAMTETAKPSRKEEEDSAELDEELVDDDLEYLEGLEDVDGAGEIDEYDEEPEPEAELPQPARPAVRERERREPRREYRPGRGGFDPEAAEIAAKAKYAFRQRVVLALIVAAVLTAVFGGFLYTPTWWLHGVVDVALVGYLGYLRRQVRIEEEIRQRRMARLKTTRPAATSYRRTQHEEDEEPEPAPLEEVEVADTRRELVGAERRPSPTSRIRRHAVVVDLDDEDPAFHELDEPGQQPFRRAVGE